MKAGDKAPDFTLYTDDKEAFSLKEKLQESNVLLLFFPGAFTSVCTDELNQVNNELDAYGDTIVAGVSTDSPFALAAFSEANGFEFPLLSDHDANVAKAFGVKYDNDFTPMKLDRVAKRSAFLIDQDGVVQYAEVTENAGVLPDLDAIKAKLDELD